MQKIATTAADRTEILLDFMTQTRADLIALDAAFNEWDSAATARIAHRMKGSSRMVGAHELAAACETMEHLVRQNGADRAHDAKRALEQALHRLHSHIATVAVAQTEQQCHQPAA